MSAQPVEMHEAPADGDDVDQGDVLLQEPLQVEVRRNAVVSALLGAAASAIAIAYLWRAAETGNVIDWVLCGALGVLGAVFLHSLLDARTPLLVADEMGVRIRLATTWRGLPWDAIERVVVRPRRGLFHDGSLVVQLTHVARTIEGLEGRARRHALVNRKVYGGSLAVPLGLGTRTDGSDDDLSDRIATLSHGRAEVVTLLPPPKKAPAEPTTDAGTDESGDVEDPTTVAPAETGEQEQVSSTQVEVTDPEPHEVADPADVGEVETATEPPARTRRRWLRRSHVRRADGGETASDSSVEEPEAAVVEETAAGHVQEIPEPPGERDDAPQPVEARAVPLRVAAPEESVTLRIEDVPRSTRAHDAVNSVREAMNPVARNDSRVRAIAKLGDPVGPLVIDNYQPEPAYDPAIGPELAASRTRIGLSVDELADRTRIRPHVIESIEVDDFTPCGGDFYARGHIRTLSRVLGKDPVPLLQIYEARYAHAPVNARKVFEAELATGMGGQMARPYGGPNWTGLVAAVLMLVLIWAAVRLFAGDGSEVLEEPPPVLDGSAGLSSYYGDPDARTGPQPVTTIVSAVNGDADVQVRDGDGNVVHDGELVIGEVKRLRVVPPVTVTSDDGGAVSVSVDGRDEGFLGSEGVPATTTFSPRAAD